MVADSINEELAADRMIGETSAEGSAAAENGAETNGHGGVCGVLLVGEKRPDGNADNIDTDISRETLCAGTSDVIPEKPSNGVPCKLSRDASDDLPCRVAGDPSDGILAEAADGSDVGACAELDEKKKKEKRRLTVYLAAVLCLTAAIIVYGVNVSNIVSSGVKKSGGSVRGLFYGEVLGRKMISERRENRSLVRIPLPTVDGRTHPGAVEPMSIPEDLLPGENEKNEIVSVDLSVGENDIFSLINGTSYSPDILSLINSFPIKPLRELHGEYGKDSPTVLLLHTHGSEAYSPEGAEYSGKDDTFRSDDESLSVVAVGDVIAEKLENNGIGVIHIREMFDIEDFNTAYDRSGKAVAETLKKYPSVKYVFDIHRDALLTDDGKNLRPLSASGEAQVMIVVGTDEAGADHPRWEDNLSVALRLQEKVGTVTPTLVRGINLQSASFGEQLSPGYLLLEVGAAGNSLSEAKAAASLVGEGCAAMIKSG